MAMRLLASGSAERRPGSGLTNTKNVHMLGERRVSPERLHGPSFMMVDSNPLPVVRGGALSWRPNLKRKAAERRAKVQGRAWPKVAALPSHPRSLCVRRYSAAVVAFAHVRPPQPCEHRQREWLLKWLPSLAPRSEMSSPRRRPPVRRQWPRPLQPSSHENAQDSPA